MKNQDLEKLQKTELDILTDFHEYCVKNGLRYYLIGGALLGMARYNQFIPWDDDIDVAMPREDYERLKSEWNSTQLNNYFLQSEKSDPMFSRAIMKLRKNGTCIIEETSSLVKMHNGIYIDIFPIDYLNSYSEFKISIRANLIHLFMSLRSVKCGYRNKRHLFIKEVLNVFLKPVPLVFFDKVIEYFSIMENRKNRRYAILYTHNYNWKRQTHSVDVFGKGILKKFCNKEIYCPDKYEDFLYKVFGANYMEEPELQKRVNPHKYVLIKYSESDDTSYVECD